MNYVIAVMGKISGGSLTTKDIKCSLVSNFNAVNIVYGSTSYSPIRNRTLHWH